MRYNSNTELYRSGSLGRSCSEGRVEYETSSDLSSMIMIVEHSNLYLNVTLPSHQWSSVTGYAYGMALPWPGIRDSATGFVNM